MGLKEEVGSSIPMSGRSKSCQGEDLRYPHVGREVRSKGADSVMAEALRSTRQPLLKTHVGGQTVFKGKVHRNSI